MQHTQTQHCQMNSDAHACIRRAAATAGYHQAAQRVLKEPVHNISQTQPANLLLTSLSLLLHLHALHHSAIPGLNLALQVAIPASHNR
jgi:hypothetical protein